MLIDHKRWVGNFPFYSAQMRIENAPFTLWGSISGILGSFQSRSILCLQRSYSYWSKFTLLGKYRVAYLHISPNCHYVLSSISKSHGRPQRTFTEILIWIKTSVFEREQRSSTLVMTFDLNLWDIVDNYTKLMGILQAASDANCRSLG